MKTKTETIHDLHMRKVRATLQEASHKLNESSSKIEVEIMTLFELDNNERDEIKHFYNLISAHKDAVNDTIMLLHKEYKLPDSH